MKISSASKKVLASALSAAMVVAFAPAAAFAAKTPDATKTVDVTYDANGGTISSGVSGETVSLQKEGDKYYIATANAPTATISGYTFDKWFIDADGDGVLDEGEKAAEGGYVEVSADTTAVTLKAAWQLPSVTVGTYAADVYTGGGSVVSDANAHKIPVTVDGTKMAAAGHTYTVKVTCPDGTSSEVAAYGADAAAVPTQSTNINVWFTTEAVTGDKTAFDAAHLTSGAYTVELADNGKVVSTAVTELAKVDVTVDDSTKSAFVQLTEGSTTANLTSINPLTSNYRAYLDADGYSVGNGISVTVTGDAAFTATKAAQAAGAVTYAEDVDDQSEPTGKAGSLQFTINNVGANKYDVAVTDPSGAAVYTATYTQTGGQTVSFDTAAAGARTSASEAAGTYVVTVTATKGTGDDAKTSVSKAKMVLTEVVYDAGEHGSFAKDAVTSYFTDEASATGIDGFKPAATPAAGYEADYATLNGDRYDAAKSKAKAGEVNTYAYVQKAVSYADAPAWSVEKKAAGTSVQYVLSVTPAAGTSVEVTIGSDSPDTITAAKSYILASDVKTVTLKATDAAGTKQAKTVEVVNVSKAAEGWASMTSGADSKLELKIGRTSTKWLAASGVASAIASGKTACEALAAKSFATSEEAVASFASSCKALYEAVAAEADAQLAAYADEAQVVVGDKVYKMDAKTYEAQSKELAKAEKSVANNVAEATSEDEKGSAYTTGVSSLISTANTALKEADEDTTVKAADITAAKAVTEQLKAATDADSAKAAIEAYNALTDAQKKLVATADVTAAQKIVADAEAAKKLADEQDEKAVKYCNSTKTKTVKLAKKAKKTAKKFSVKWNSQVSESGNKVTYAKKSGSAKVTVSANGKATLKKGVKKGTYKAKVKVSCGNATRTVTAKFIVK